MSIPETFEEWDVEQCLPFDKILTTTARAAWNASRAATIAQVLDLLANCDCEGYGDGRGHHVCTTLYREVEGWK